MAPLYPQENARGLPPRPRPLAACSSKSCGACRIGCGVHGFAMNPCYSSPFATAPYCREARVTGERRQTACGMRHCFARRIVECSVRRKLGCTSTRWAERQRIVEAEASRLAALNAATPRYGQCNRQALHLFELLACNVKAFLLGFQRGYSLLRKRIPPLTLPPAGGISLRTCAKSRDMFSVKIQNFCLQTLFSVL